MSTIHRRWRDYRTPAGARPIRDFLMEQSDGARAEIAAAMKDVRKNGLEVARHLRGDLYEVRASHAGMQYRIIFANEGKKGRVLLSLHGFAKTTQKTPKRYLDLAERRLKEWRANNAGEEDEP